MYNSFEDFSAEDYLREYYDELEAENKFLLDFFIDVYSQIPANGILLEAGGGPTLYQLISAANTCKSIIFSDYAPQNLAQIKTWQQNRPDAYDWGPYFNYIAQKTGINQQSLEENLRNKIQQITSINLKNPANPLTETEQAHYDIVSSNFCTESMTQYIEEFYTGMQILLSFIAPGGSFVGSFLKEASGYRAGDLYFPAVAVNEKMLTSFCEKNNLAIHEMRTIAAEPGRDYAGIICLWAGKEK